MHHTLTRNRTYGALDRAQQPLYKNIRTMKREQMVQGGARWDGDELYVLPPPPPPSGGHFSPSRTHNSSEPGPWIPANAYYGWQIPNSTTVDEFSAACWYFAQEITDMAADENKPVPVIGLVQSAWGGSQIQVWLKNDTVANCKNTSGFPEQNRCRGKNCAKNGFNNNGVLWNGMTAPFVNYTIFGALWCESHTPKAMWTAFHVDCTWEPGNCSSAPRFEKKRSFFHTKTLATRLHGSHEGMCCSWQIKERTMSTSVSVLAPARATTAALLRVATFSMQRVMHARSRIL